MLYCKCFVIPYAVVKPVKLYWEPGHSRPLSRQRESVFKAKIIDDSCFVAMYSTCMQRGSFVWHRELKFLSRQ